MEHENFIGLMVDLVLTDGSAVSGTVFSYVADKKILVLAMPKNGDSSDFKMIRTPFIEKMSIEPDRTKIPADKQLPHAFQTGESLPPVNKNVLGTAKATKYLTNEMLPKRSKILKSIHSGDGEAPPVGAVEIFCELQRVYNEQATWNAEDQVIEYSGLVISGRPDWSNPVVTVVNGTVVSDDFKDRINKLVQKKASWK